MVANTVSNTRGQLKESSAAAIEGRDCCGCGCGSCCLIGVGDDEDGGKKDAVVDEEGMMYDEDDFSAEARRGVLSTMRPWIIRCPFYCPFFSRKDFFEKTFFSKRVITIS